jgi:hypothetical protein
MPIKFEGFWKDCRVLETGEFMGSLGSVFKE